MSQLDQIYHQIDRDLDSVHSINENSEIQRFYVDKTIFITGATGFMGKCLVEKLLRSCPGIKCIYLLIRESKALTVDDRLKKYFQDKIFSRLVEVNPNSTKKVIALKGDLNLERCGLSDVDIQILKRDTNIIYHAAANVIFTAKVKESLTVNVLATKYILDLAKECQKLEILMYFSTAYSHCYMKCIEENFYEPPGNLSLVHKMIETDDRIGMDEVAVQEWIGKYPNIYTFSKAIAEDLVRQHSRSASHACGIYRPSIVVATYEEPIAGWNNGLNGAVVIFLLYGLGIIHVMHHYCYPMDFIPCDMSINVLLAMTWDLKDQWTKLKQKEAIIYNYGSSCVNPTNFKELGDSNKNVEGIERSRYAVSMNFAIFTPHRWVFWILDKLFHLLPAYLADATLVLTGRKPKAVDVYSKVHKHMDKIDYWGNGNWRIHINNSQRVVDGLNNTDKKLFFCDLRNLDWAEWCSRMWRGMLIHYLREEFPNEKGRRRYILLCIIYYGIIWSFCLTVLYFTSKLFL